MLGSARTRFLEAATERDADEPVGLAAGLQLVLDLLKDPKKASALAQKALEAQRVIDEARKARDAIEALQRKADADLAATKAEIERLRREHETAVAVAAKEIAGMKKQASDLLAKAEADAKAASADKLEQRKRLQAVERAVEGTV